MNKINMQIKIMHQRTANGKYMERMHEDLEKMMPRATRVPKTIESLILMPDDQKTEQVLRASSVKLNEFFDDFHGIEQWYDRINVTKKTRKKKDEAGADDEA